MRDLTDQARNFKGKGVSGILKDTGLATDSKIMVLTRGLSLSTTKVLKVTDQVKILEPLVHAATISSRSPPHPSLANTTSLP